jgi:prolyl oligopeptidase
VTIDSTALETDNEQSLAWQRGEDTAAEQVLRALPAYQPFVRRLQDALVSPSSLPQRRCGDRWFQQVRPSDDADQMVVGVRTSPTGELRVLIDPVRLAEERSEPLSLLWAEPSPDGTTLAYALQVGGAERAEVHLLDVASGEPVPDVVSHDLHFGFTWQPDSKGFYGSAKAIVDGRYETTIVHYLLGQPAPAGHEGAPDDLLFPFPVVSPDGRIVGARCGNTEPRLEYVRIDGGDWTPFLRDVPGCHGGVFHGDAFIAVVDDQHPRGRLVSIPVATPTDQSTWTELVPEGDDVLRWVRVVGGRLVLGFVRDAAMGIRVLELDGTPVEELKLPGRGCIDVFGSGFTQLNLPMFYEGEGEISFLYSTPTSSYSIWRYVVAAGELTEVEPAKVRLEGLVVRQVVATGSDGLRVPATLVHRQDLDLSQPHPTLIHGYGGYAVGLIPAYRAIYTEFARAGGVLALAHLRGGTEFGKDWWLAGRRERKQQTFDDVYAIAEELVRLGITTPHQLAVEGGSNGGTMAGAVVTQRPDLFTAVVSHVPQLDCVHMDRDPVGFAICSVEYGNPAVPEERAWLEGYSPRQNIRAGVAYPATLVSAGANDPRCPAWHSRVFAHELRAAQAGDAPILLRVHADQGHGAAERSRSLEQAAEWLAFVAHHTGLVVD